MKIVHEYYASNFTAIEQTNLMKIFHKKRSCHITLKGAGMDWKVTWIVALTWNFVKMLLDKMSHDHVTIPQKLNLLNRKLWQKQVMPLTCYINLSNFTCLLVSVLFFSCCFTYLYLDIFCILQIICLKWEDQL